MISEKETHTKVIIQSVLVIDDHPLYCDALASSLERIYDARSIKKANSLNEGLKLVGARFSPDLVILDLRLPDVTGLSGFLKIKDKLPDVPVLVISAESSTEAIQAMMSAGAAGFVTKDSSHKVLQEALMTIREGRKYLPAQYSSSARPTPEEMSAQEIAQRIADLTPQQSRIMRLICAGKPNKQIAYELSLAEATVKAHITALLRRLGVNNRTQAAVLVRSASFDENSSLSEADARALLS
ncbi:response regulator [Algicella marina]|uniref:Response regulator n=1 Tax=Algicella marina TaxID=2683284 RepID=A0A6P1T5Z0_9RHOB|nr:response regulator transcription factor [Algicella marina]QHQ37457.1 response regulator [Algicella marina]